MGGAVLAAVIVGNALYPMLEIDELTPNRRTGAIGLAATAHNRIGQLGRPASDSTQFADPLIG